MSTIGLISLASELAGEMGETWAALERERRDWWIELASHIDRRFDSSEVDEL